MSILSLIVSSSISNLFQRELIFKWPIINRLAFLILISWRVFIWFTLSWKSAEIIACFVFKRCLGPAVSDFLLQSLLHKHFKTQYRGRTRLPSLLPISIKAFSTQLSEFLIKFIANFPFPCLFRWRPEPTKCSDEIDTTICTKM